MILSKFFLKKWKGIKSNFVFKKKEEEATTLFFPVSLGLSLKRGPARQKIFQNFWSYPTLHTKFLFFYIFIYYSTVGLNRKFWNYFFGPGHVLVGRAGTRFSDSLSLAGAKTYLEHNLELIKTQFRHSRKRKSVFSHFLSEKYFFHI